MRLLVTGACGFVGSRVLRRLRESLPDAKLTGLDNLSRPGSEQNQPVLRDLGVTLVRGDVRKPGDFKELPDVDWLIDAAANPSVVAGVDGGTSSRDIIENNLVGTVNMLEFCRERSAGFILLSSSRVYSVAPLSNLPLRAAGSRFELDASQPLPSGTSARGVSETFSTTPPLSLYGVSKKAGEDLALEYGAAFHFPVWINRCGLLAGAGQFGKPDQGIIAYWIHSWQEGQPLRYLGFGGHGYQVRDALHPDDLAALLLKQIRAGAGHPETPRVLNVGGGPESAFSLAELSAWCAGRFRKKVEVIPDGRERPFDVGWLVLDDSRARAAWNWKPAIPRDALFEEVARFAEANDGWLSVSGAT